MSVRKICKWMTRRKHGAREVKENDKKKMKNEETEMFKRAKQ